MATRGKGAKIKGNSFERKIAKLLSMWYFGVTDRLKRTPMSGGFSSSFSGDIFEDTEVNLPQKSDSHKKYFPFNIECKKQEVTLDLASLFSEKSSFWKFWRQAQSEKNKLQYSLLIFAKNHSEILVAFKVSLLNRILEANKINYILYSYITSTNGIDEVAIVKLKDFVHVPKEVFYQEGGVVYE